MNAQSFIRIISILLSLCFIPACATLSKVEHPVSEEIVSILYQPDADGAGKVYALGRLYDYEIQPCDQKLLTRPHELEKCKDTLKVILENKEFIEDVRLDFQLRRNEDEITVSGSYVAIIPQNRITTGLPFVKKLKEANQNNQNKNHLNMMIQFYGKVVKFDNKNEILALGKLKQPLAVNTQITEYQSRRSVKPLLQITGAIIMIPVGVVLMVPAMYVIGHCEKTNC